MSDMDDTVRVPMTEAEKAAAGERCGELLAQIEAAEASRKKANDAAKTDIERLTSELDALGQDLREGRVEKRQGDLFVDAKLPPDQAAATLAKVATLPTEAHAFEGPDGGECTICGAHRPDPIHGHEALVAEGLKVAGEMPDGKARDFLESLARTAGGDPVEDVVEHVKARRAKRRGRKAEAGA